MRELCLKADIKSLVFKMLLFTLAVTASADVPHVDKKALHHYKTIKDIS